MHACCKYLHLRLAAACNCAGYKLSCPTTVVDYPASTGGCPAAVTWTGTAGGNGTKVCLRDIGAGVLEFGTIESVTAGTVDPADKCHTWDPAVTAWQRVCMRVFKQ